MADGSRKEPLDLITIIVQRGRGDEMAKAAIAAGAQAATISFARGTGVRERMKFFGVAIQPEKEVIFTVVPRSLADTVYDALVEAGRLHEPGMGFIYVHEVRRATGWLTADLKEAT